MKECRNCGFINIDTQQRCLKCNYILEHQEIKTPKLKDHKRVFTLNRLTSPIYSFQYKFLNFLSPTVNKDLPYRYPLLAGFLALLPGGGSLYNHQIKKSLILILIYLIFSTVIFITLNLSYSNYIILFFILFLFFCYTDAFSTSLKINGQEWSFRYTASMFSYLFFMIGIIFTAGQFFLQPVFLLVNVKQNVFAPNLIKSDRLFVDCLGYFFTSPKKGDIIYYYPKSFNLFHGENMYTVREKNSFERIIAIGGEKVVIKDRTIYVNDKQISKDNYPLGEYYPPNAEIIVPEKKYLAIFSHLAEDKGMIFGLGAAKMPIMSISNFEEVCLIEKNQIKGRVLFRYNPPERRRFF